MQPSSSRLLHPLHTPDISQANAAYEEMQQQNTALLALLTQRDTSLTDLQTAKQVVEQQLEAVQQQAKEVQARLVGLQGEHSALQGVKEALEKDLVKAQADLAQVRHSGDIHTVVVTYIPWWRSGECSGMLDCYRRHAAQHV
jgi:thiamine biosynthesis lipoprotein ApbE